jgi:hypothetical protein
MLRRAASGTLASSSSRSSWDALAVVRRRMSSAFGASTSVHATSTPSIERWSAELMEVRLLFSFRFVSFRDARERADGEWMFAAAVVWARCRAMHRAREVGCSLWRVARVWWSFLTGVQSSFLNGNSRANDGERGGFD